jgi:hypothetical protein
MLKLQAIHDKEITLDRLPTDLTPGNLHGLTNEMVDCILDLISGCVDADVTFEPLDPEADDPHAKTPEEVKMPWSLGHVIVHTTASAEEAAALAAELARGVEYHGRSRYETPWQEMKTIEECLGRLEESRRMRLASLELWPEEAHLDMVCEVWPGGPRVNAVGRFVLGLMHEDSHLKHIAEIVRQARAARGE